MFKQYFRVLFLLLAPFSLFLTAISAQTWESVGEGIVCRDDRWEPGEPDTIYSSVYTLCVYGEKLYAAGMFQKAGKVPINNIARWDGLKWDSLGKGTNGWIKAIGIHRNMLIICGVFNRAGGKIARNVARWIDTLNTKPSWYYYPVGVWRSPHWYLADTSGKAKYFNQAIDAVIDYNKNTYIGGWFAFAEDGGGGGNMSVWDTKNERWSLVKNVTHDSIDPAYEKVDLGFEYASVNCFAVFNKKLFIFRDFNLGQRNILVWDDFSFKRMTPNFPDVFTKVDCSAVSDSGLYFAGSGGFGKGLKTDAIARLNNDGSYKVIDGLPSKSTIYSMVCYNNKLYVAGQIDKIDGKTFNNIACWDGKQWSPVGSGLSRKKRPQTTVRSLCVYNGYLYAGGNFTCSGDKTILGIARYKLDGTKPPPSKKKA